MIGASHWHVPLFVAAWTEVHCVVGLSDDDPARVADLAAGWGLTPDADWRRTIEVPGVELAYVFGPHDRMAEVCLALVERRIPFVVEKPLGTSLDQLQAVRRAAAAAGVAATVPLVQRGGPVDRWLAKAGTPVYQRHSFLAGPPQRYADNGNAWMLDAARAGGGCLANLGPHFVDLFMQATGERSLDVTARLTAALHSLGVEDHATAVLSTPDSRQGLIEVGYTFPASGLKRYCSWTSAGSEGFAAIDSDGSATFTDIAGATEHGVLDVDSDPLYDRFARLVASTFHDGFRGLPTLADLEDVMRVVWHAYRVDQEAGHRG